MQNITIGRYPEDPQAQGVIKPEDGRWQLVLDREGYPHLYVQINTTDDEGKPVKVTPLSDPVRQVPARRRLI